MLNLPNQAFQWSGWVGCVEEQPPQVLLLDLELPDMDGMALLRYVSEQGLPTSVVVITAHGSVDITEQCGTVHLIS